MILMSIISTQMLPVFLVIIFAMAFMYASVGHGGASGYLATLALFSVEISMMKSSALVLNIFVSLISFIQYYRGGYFKWKLFLPFAIASIPASYVGATIPLSEDIYKRVLGFCLLVAVIRLAGFIDGEHTELRELKWVYGLVIGGVIGFLSGMIGIGGGIILSPVILLFYWAKMRETAAVSALFILVNSISGLSALIIRGYSPSSEIYVWIIVAVAGGFLGAYFGSRKFDSQVLKYLLSLVLLIASLKLIFS